MFSPARLCGWGLVVIACSCKPHGNGGLDWKAPDTARIPATEEGRLIRYGRDLIANTAYYLGPKGTKAVLTNGMNCQNCHLDAGTKAWGNNYSAVYATYPKFRDRSGSVENIHRRVNDCLERSLNGRPLDTNSLEMKAISAYLRWLGQDVPKGTKPAGAGIRDIPFLDRAADPEKGRLVYQQLCQRCHGADGQGTLNPDSASYRYPPLWGAYSYTTGAGLYRISRLAGLVKDNMPYGGSHDAPLLTDEQAWDVAAFINSQPRPEKVFPKDWPDIARKPVDQPFGPYADTFSAMQHKYGPFSPIRNVH
ncbi:c-type cytochrome [Dinghuibacter silviterrae]|uniref:Thiosulfate dehydrogenase n=1 Tax=Dinghuibacter silviterrae TaxID=1539049 RepID=A0A4R8DVL8_9BACT|nr:c-type cytochrome [Dinghuibacter silviterrae]TDX01457.1 thiosulfate dehydrogenase [Dinghuibacter silviterrae]